MAVGKISKVYQHWADEGNSWNNNILSANKSEYSEGEVIPHVYVFKASNQVPLVNGQEYTITITYNHYQANTNAGGFAFITDFNTSRTPGSLPGASPGQDPVIDSTFTNGGGIQGSFYTVDADITNVSDVTFTGTGTKDGQVTVTFIYTGPTTTNGIAEIYYGLQIAAPGDVPDQGVGTTNGAHAWTGGSLQTTVSVGGSGATSIQLSPAAIVVTNPDIEIVKTAGAIQDLDDNGLDAGDQVTYTYTVTNTGDVTLSGVAVVDDNGTPGNTLDDIPITLGDTELSPDEVTNGTYTKTLSQADIDAGSFTNLGTATGTPPTGGPVTDDDPETVQLPADPAIEIVKTAGAIQDLDDNGLDAGDQVTYTYTVTNIGNVTLSGVTAVDDNGTPGNALDDIPITLGDTELSPDEVTDGTYTKTLSQADIDAGSFTNLGTATGTTPAGGTVTDDDPETVDLAPGAAIDIVKTGTLNDDNDDGDADVGDTITYTYTVTNTGNVTLSGVTVVDDNGTPGNTLDDIPITLGDTELSPGEVTDGTYTKTLSQADIDAGSFTNLGTATGTTPAGGTVTDDDPETVDLPDDSPVVGERDISVDEDFLAVGNQDLPIPSPGDDTGDASVTDTFPIDFGSDFDGATISFAGLDGDPVTDTLGNPVTTSDGDLPLTYVWDEATDTLYGSTDPADAEGTAAFTLQVTNPGIGNVTGSFVFTVNQALEHGQEGTPNTEDPNIELALDYLATDADQDEEIGTLGITIDDDIPIRAADATPIATTVEEDGMSIVDGDPGGLNGPDQSEGNPAPAGDSTDDDQKTSLVAGSLALLVAVGADAPPTFGLDSDTSSLPELSSNGDAVTYTTIDSDSDGILDTLVGTADGRTVFTLKVNTDGTWEFDLDDQLDHVDDAGNSENTDLLTTGSSVPSIDFSSIIQVTDADGDTVNVLVGGDFTIAVEDDIPELTDAENLSVENVVGSAGTASGQATFSVGADEPVSFIITDATGVEGVDYTISDGGKTVTGHADLDGDGVIEAGEDLYTFTIDDTGAYTFELLAELPPPDPVPFSAAGIASGSYPNLTLASGDLRLVLDAKTAAGADTSLQVSQASGGGIGVVQNTIENEESVTFSFEKANGTEVAASSFTVLFKADAGDPDYVWTATLEDGTVVTLDDGGADNSGGADVTYDPVGSGDLVATVELASGEKFTDVQLQIVGDQNDKAKLGVEGFSFTPATPDVNLAFDIQATDADGDTATLQTVDYDNDTDLDSLAVHIEADGDPSTLANAAMQTYLESLSTSV